MERLQELIDSLEVDKEEIFRRVYEEMKEREMKKHFVFCVDNNQAIGYSIFKR